MFHRVEDPLSLGSRRLMKLAARLGAYSGAVRARLEMQRQQERELAAEMEQEEPDAAVAPPPQPRRAGSPVDPAAQAGGVAQAGLAKLPRHSYTETPDMLLPGPQIAGAEVVPATPAALALSEMGHLFSFGKTG